MFQQLNQHSEIIQTYMELLDSGYMVESPEQSYRERPLFNCTISTVESDPLTAIHTPQVVERISGDYYAFIAIVSGQGYWVSPHTEHRITAGSILFIKAKHYYTFHFTQRYKAVSFNVPGELLQHYLPRLPRHGDLIRGDISAYFRHLLGYESSDEPSSVQSRENMERYLLNQLRELLLQDKVSDHARQRIQHLVYRHATDEGFCIDWLADRCNASRRYLFKLFEQQPVSLSQYIHKAQLGQAFSLLADANKQHLQVGDIALQSGFKTQAHFSRLFKQRYQMTPRQLRQILTAALAGG